MRTGDQEDIIVGLRNQSKTNSSISIFGIIASITHPKNPNEVYKKVSHHLHFTVVASYFIRAKL